MEGPGGRGWSACSARVCRESGVLPPSVHGWHAITDPPTYRGCARGRSVGFPPNWPPPPFLTPRKRHIGEGVCSQVKPHACTGNKTATGWSFERGMPVLIAQQAE